MSSLNINTDQVVRWTNKLEKMHRSALPLAIRGSLNSAAKDVKQKTMPATSKASFVNRSKNFFKFNSRVEFAKGFNVKSMQAMVGFTSARLKGGDNFAVKDLEQQERGGKIGGKSFIAHKEARGGSNTKAVKPINRLSAITNIINAKNFRGNKKQRLIRAIHRAGKGGYVLGSAISGENTLFRVKSLNKKGAFKLTPLYDFKKGRKVSVTGTGFMRIASLKSGSKIESFYIKEAKKQIKRLTGK